MAITTRALSNQTRALSNQTRAHSTRCALLLAEADGNNDGLLDFKEYVAWAGSRGGLRARAGAKLGRAAGRVRKLVSPGGARSFFSPNSQEFH